MERKIQEAVESLRALLQMGESVTVVDGTLERGHFVGFCDKCQKAVHCETIPSGWFVRCPRCNYAVLTCHPINRYWECTITDDKGTVVTDCNGIPRIFEGEAAAKDYIRLCGFNSNLVTIERIQYRDGFYGREK